MGEREAFRSWWWAWAVEVLALLLLLRPGACPVVRLFSLCWSTNAVRLSGCPAVFLFVLVLQMQYGCPVVRLSVPSQSVLGCLVVWLSGCFPLFFLWLSGCFRLFFLWLSGCPAAGPSNRAGCPVVRLRVCQIVLVVRMCGCESFVNPFVSPL